MSLLEEAYKVKPIPDVESAILTLIDAREDSCLAFSGECWYENPGGEPVEIWDSADEAIDFDPIVDEDEPALIRRISGMPLLSLYFHPMKDDRWCLFLELEIPSDPLGNDATSFYTMFRQSMYAHWFKEDNEYAGIVTVSRFLGRDTALAARLISYYIRYYDHEADYHME